MIKINSDEKLFFLRKPVFPIILKKRFQLPWKNPKQLSIPTSNEKKYVDIRKGFLLSVAYSATIGGLSSLVGTAPNIFVKGFADRLKNLDICLT